MKKLFLLILTILFVSCQKEAIKNTGEDTSKDDLKQIVILYTNDEHGWMEQNDFNSGASGMVYLWKEDEGYTEEGPFLVLSGGDQWTGPAISTLTSGESMVEIMNAMGYEAAAIGNHEFDFTIDSLRVRIAEMEFPFLASNIIEKQTGDYADFTKRFLISEVNDVTIGIIGLASVNTPRTTKPANVAAYNFIPYATALRKVVPDVKSNGAELLIVVGHICENEMQDLLPLADSLGIVLIAGGHCHEEYNYKKYNTTLIQSGSHLDNYVRVDILFDDREDKVVKITSSRHTNRTDNRNPEISAIINKWRDQLDDTLTEVIGYVQKDIPEGSVKMQNMITDSWLFAIPTADIALTNTGGIRQDIPAGNITLETMFGLLPFSNSIYQLKLTGSELMACLDDENGQNLVMSGLKINQGYRLNNGNFIQADSIYLVLTNDYLYSLPELNFRNFDPEPYDTGIHYRQPVIDWIKSVKSSKENPIDNMLDSKPRR